MAERDGVDVVLEQWAAVRPELDYSPVGIVGRLSRASRLLERAVKEGLARHDLEGWEFDVLATLMRAGEPHTLTAGELSRAAMVSAAALTNRVDRLVARGLVRRDVDPGSRRRVLVSLTNEGHALVNVAIEDHVAHEDSLLSALPVEERERLAATLRTLLLSLGDEAG